MVVTELSLEGKCRGLSLTVRLTVKVREECAKSHCLFTFEMSNLQILTVKLGL